jgi:hypothetical protein
MIASKFPCRNFVRFARVLRSLGYGLDNLKIVFRIPTEAKEFYLLLSVQYSSEAHPVTFQQGKEDDLPGGERVKRPKRESDLSLPSTAEDKNQWKYYRPPLLHILS